MQAKVVIGNATEGKEREKEIARQRGGWIRDMGSRSEFLVPDRGKGN
jgi:hypothetical protein